MDALRKAAEQMLEAAENRLPLIGQAAIIDELNALRATLAEQEPEQVCSNSYGCQCPKHYTHPPRREWVSLTEEEMHGLYRRAGLEAYYPRDGAVQYEYERRFDAFARAIEAALKEKNHG